MSILNTYAGFVPGVIVSIFVSVALARRAGRTLDVGPVLGFGIVMSLGIVLSATVTPSREALVNGMSGIGVCDLTRDGLAWRNQLAWPSEVLLNILLFLPLGIAAGLCPPSRAKLAVAFLAVLSPFAIEVTQLIAVPLGRACQSGDVIDNLTGLIVGVLIGSAARWLAAARSSMVAEGHRFRSGAAGIAALTGVFVILAMLLSPPSATLPAPTLTPAELPASSRERSPGASVTVSSIPALLTALADNRLDEIVVANGTYLVSDAADKLANSLWIGSTFASRTKPVVVRAETPGGVTLDGSEAETFGGITFVEGAHHQTWEGFVFTNGSPKESGVIMFGGYAGQPGAHHITLRDITIDRSVTSSQPAGTYHDHAVYFSWSVGGVHDIVIDGFTVDGSGPQRLDSAIHFYHSDAANRNAWNVLIRNMHVTGTKAAILVWDATVSNIVIEDSTISDAVSFAVRYEAGGSLTLRRVTSTGSGSQGFYSSLGATPSGVTFDGSALQ